MLKIKIRGGKIILPFIPEEDAPDGLHLTLKEDFMPLYTRERLHLTNPIVKGQVSYALPPKVIRDDIYSIAVALPNRRGKPRISKNMYSSVPQVWQPIGIAVVLPLEEEKQE